MSINWVKSADSVTQLFYIFFNFLICVLSFSEREVWIAANLIVDLSISPFDSISFLIHASVGT